MSDMEFVTLTSFVIIALLMIAAAVPIASPVRHVFAEFNVKVMTVYKQETIVNRS
jgi:hypothetical protein